MAAYNRNFELNISDIDLIEAALRSHKKVFSLERIQLIETTETSPDKDRLDQINTELARVNDLLGRLHNQKVFFRPGPSGKAPYVSG